MKPAPRQRSRTGLPLGSPASSAAENAAMPPQGDPPRRGHCSFRSAFEEALQVTDLGPRPQEIRVRWNRAAGAYIWTVRN